jgi:molybdopterin-guanine dinucleotide biosynthesis adapter protein
VASDVDPPDGFTRIDIDAICQLTDFIVDHALSRPTA